MGGPSGAPVTALTVLESLTNLRNEVETAEAEVQQQHQTNQQLKDQLEHLRTGADRLRQTIVESRRRKEGLQELGVEGCGDTTRVEQRKGVIARQIDAIQSEHSERLSHVDEIVDSFVGKGETFRAGAQSACRRLVSKRERLMLKEAALHKGRAKLCSAESEVSHAQEFLDEVQAELIARKVEARERASKLSRLDKSRRAAQRECEDLRREVAAVEESNEELRAVGDALAKENAVLANELRNLERAEARATLERGGGVAGVEGEELRHHQEQHQEEPRQQRQQEQQQPSRDSYESLSPPLPSPLSFYDLGGGGGEGLEDEDEEELDDFPDEQREDSGFSRAAAPNTAFPTRGVDPPSSRRSQQRLHGSATQHGNPYGQSAPTDWRRESRSTPLPRSQQQQQQQQQQQASASSRFHHHL